jgi:hypothetical protein
MKTSHSKPRPKTYLCRKCTRVDFKAPIEFTNHLRNCRGGTVPPTLIPKEAPSPGASNGKGLRQELLRLRTLGIEVRDLADKLLKQIK